MAKVAGDIPVPVDADEEPAATADRARVLLVDDDEHNLLAVATLLEDLGEIVLARSADKTFSRTLHTIA